MSTCADSTLGKVSIFAFASAAMVGPMPQPWAVSVIFTEIACLPEAASSAVRS